VKAGYTERKTFDEDYADSDPGTPDGKRVRARKKQIGTLNVNCTALHKVSAPSPASTTSRTPGSSTRKVKIITNTIGVYLKECVV
jgi:hypothetical protein